MQYCVVLTRLAAIRSGVQEAQNALEGVWEGMEERSDMAHQLIDAWKNEAEKQRALARTKGLKALKEELQAKQVCTMLQLDSNTALT